MTYVLSGTILFLLGCLWYWEIWGSKLRQKCRDLTRENTILNEHIHRTPSLLNRPLSDQISLEEHGDIIIAEWFLRKPGMPTVGRGSTVLEAVGSLCIYDQVIELRPSPLVDTKFSVSEPACPRR